MEGLPCFLNRKLDLKSSAPKTENREHIFKTLDFIFTKIRERVTLAQIYCFYLLSHLLGRCAAELLSCCVAALHHTAAGSSGVAQQVGVDGVC